MRQGLSSGDLDQRRPDRADFFDDTPPRCVRHGGMSLHADVAVPARDRARLERLCRYMARPPIATERLEAVPNGRLTDRLKTPWRDGTTHILMERHELLERQAPLIPPLRAHQVRYHGVLAPCARGRDRVVPGAAERGSSVGAAPDTLAMRILSAITDAEVARRILECLALPTRAPPNARAPDSSEMRYGPVESALEQQPDVPEFDQRQPREWDFGA